MKEKEGKTVTQIFVLYCSVHGGEKKKKNHMKRTKALLHLTFPHDRKKKQNDKMMCV